MGYLALYRKYRPTSFDNIVGQSETITIIKNSIENNKVSHAYLFSGPRGTGKTTTAKIIAKMVNCENLVNGKLCGKCHSCLEQNDNDIIEIDAASNNGVDEIRLIKDSVNLVPSRCKYKIYIIDEVHMLTTQAFNALLKTLEEPPSHIIFILATTEYYKIPLTIISRCQKFQFNKLTINDIVSNLEYISNCENVKIEKSALIEIAKVADGAMRDAINLLDQLISYKQNDICVEDFYKICDIVSEKEIFEFLNQLYFKDRKSIIDTVEKINLKGYNIQNFIEDIIYFLKDALIYKYNNSEVNLELNEKLLLEMEKLYSEKELSNLIVKFNDILNKIKITNYPSIIMIVELLNYINDQNKDSATEHIEKIHVLPKFDNMKDKDKIVESNSNNEIKNIGLLQKNIELRINNAFATADKNYLLELKDKWDSINDYVIDDVYGAIAGILKDSYPVVAGNEYIILSSSFDTLTDRLNEEYIIAETLLSNIFHRKIKMVSLSDSQWQKEKKCYLENRKKQKEYVLIEEKNQEIENNNSDITDLINIIGEECIEYK